MNFRDRLEILWHNLTNRDKVQELEEEIHNLRQYQQQADRLLDRVLQLEQDLHEARIQIESAKSFISERDKKIERLQSHVCEVKEYTIDMPEIEVEDLKKALKLADKFTLETLLQYIKIDSYKLVKNLAKVTNSSNASETIAYRDGALGRNEALIQLLSESIKGKSFQNRIKWEEQNTSHSWVNKHPSE